MNLTTQQLENIQVDYGIIYLDYGLASQEFLGPCRGGGEFTAGQSLRDIEYDGARGKTKGMKYIDDIFASLKTSVLTTASDTLIKLMPSATLTAGVIKSGDIGAVDSSKYFSNVTMFAKVTGGGYKKITINNALNESDLKIKAAPKSEAEIELEFHAHFDATNDAVSLYEISDVANITGDVAAPTVITVPADAATGIVVTANLTATFNEAVRAGDINSNNVKLFKATDGTLVAGTLTYNTTTKVATFDPTASLSASTAYIWDLSNIRDLNGNVLANTIVNFTTA